MRFFVYGGNAPDSCDALPSAISLKPCKLLAGRFFCGGKAR